MNEIDKLIDDLGLTEKERVYIDAYSKGYNDGYSGARKIFRNKQQWIPCSERLPDSQEDVLCDDDGRVTIGYYTDEEIGWHDTHSYRIYPTAWMPLPEPYKGESNG